MIVSQSLMNDHMDVLRKHFGHSSLRPGQAEVVDRVMEGVNSLAVLPTGGGKSLCYQLPATVLDGLTIVISPLIALMRDQVKALTGKGITAARLDSSVDEEVREKVHDQIGKRELSLLYISPERLEEPGLIKLLKSVSISLVAIDEAHCISEWGHSFRPSYIRLPRLVKSLKPRCILALTATASPRAAQGIRRAFSILKRDQISTSFYRENLSFHVSACKDEDKKERLLDVVKSEGRVPAIVYATRRNDVETLASFLKESGVNACAYHAGMPAEARAEVQDGFVEHRVDVICATIAFGMGVDMADVRSVIHYHPPKSPEGWIQESGRAGRDGKASYCEVLMNQDDRMALEGMVQAKRPNKYTVRAVIQNIFAQGSRAILSRYRLSTENDFPVELFDILLARLEIEGWIVPDGMSWMWCHLVPLRWGDEARKRLLKGFFPQQQELFSEMLSSRQRVNLYDLVEGDVIKMNKIVKQLRELELGGEVKLKMSHSLMHYRLKKSPESIEPLVTEMLNVFDEHCGYDMNRIDTVFQMAMSRQCLASSLIAYFGEKLPQRCGQCSSCLGNKLPRILPQQKVEELKLVELEMIQNLISEKRPALSSAERLARFLGGIYSPAMMRYRLYRHDSWALLERLPYEDILACAKAQLR